MDPYILIGITKESTFEQAKEAYIRRVKVLHPDRFNQQKQKQEWLEANKMLRQINLAWEIIEAEYKIESKNQQNRSPSPSKENNSNSKESAFGSCPNCGNPVGEKSNFCSKCQSVEAGIVQASSINKYAIP